MFRGKEIPPEITIQNAKSFFKKCNISFDETWFDSKIRNIYSVRLTIKGTKYGTNGKGVSKEYALASAYGEMIERIVNGVLFKSGEYTESSSPFKYYPDEYIIIDDKLFENNTILSVALDNLNPDYNKAFRHWRSTIPSNYLYCIEFRSEINGCLQPVPIKALKTYGSNGMAAGNSLDEAIVQAVSEIFERYCIKQIIDKEISPPHVPMEYIRNNLPDIYRTITEICKHGLSVEIKDCSLGLGFPVVGVCIFDKTNHTDSICLGAHPSFEIALERALTESFQGRSVFEISNPIYSKNRDKTNNKLSIIKNGIGRYPYNFYSSKYSYSFSVPSNQTFNNNHELKSFVLEVCQRNHFDVFTHSNTLQGFCCVQVIIPGLSEIIQIDELFLITERTRKALSKIEDLGSLSDTEHQMYLEFIDYCRKNPENFDNLSRNVPININDNYYISILKTLFIGFLRIKIYDRAGYYLNLLKPYINLDLYNALSVFVDMTIKNYNRESISTVLSHYFSEDEILQAYLFVDSLENNPFYKFSHNDIKNNSELLISIDCIKRNIH